MDTVPCKWTPVAGGTCCGRGISLQWYRHVCDAPSHWGLYPPPPLSFPAPFPSLEGGGGGPSLGEPQKGPSHRPRVLSKAFLWKVVSMFKNSRSNGAGRRNSTPSESRSKFPYIGSPLGARMIFILLHYLLSFVTVTSSAHQRFLCCVISSSAAISVPHSVRVQRYYGPLGGGGGPSLGDRPPGGGGGPSFLGWGRTRGGEGMCVCVCLEHELLHG